VEPPERRQLLEDGHVWRDILADRTVVGQARHSDRAPDLGELVVTVQLLHHLHEIERLLLPLQLAKREPQELVSRTEEVVGLQLDDIQ